MKEKLSIHFYQNRWNRLPDPEFRVKKISLKKHSSND